MKYRPKKSVAACISDPQRRQCKREEAPGKGMQCFRDFHCFYGNRKGRRGTRKRNTNFLGTFIAFLGTSVWHCIFTICVTPYLFMSLNIYTFYAAYFFNSVVNKLMPICLFLLLLESFSWLVSWQILPFFVMWFFPLAFVLTHLVFLFLQSGLHSPNECWSWWYTWWWKWSFCSDCQGHEGATVLRRLF